MIFRPLAALLAFAVLPSFLALAAATPSAALTPAEAECRDVLATSTVRYAVAAAKTVAKCHQLRSAGSRPLSVDCNEVAEADAAGKLGMAREKALNAMTAACNGSEQLLDLYTACPAPAASADDGGATTGIDNFGEVADCLLALAAAHAGALASDDQGLPSERLLDPLRKCQGRLGKGGNRLMLTTLMERRRCQARADATGTGSYACEGADPRGRIASSASRFSSKTGAFCNFSSEALGKLEACDDDTAGLLACSAASAGSHGSALIRAAYGLDGTSTTTTTLDNATTTTNPGLTTTTLPGTGTACAETFPDCNGSCGSFSSCQTVGGACQCVANETGPCAPATIKRKIISQFDPVIDSVTTLNAGWSGLAMGIDVPDRAGDIIDVDCDENCENCEVSLHREPDGTIPACSCTSDTSIPCGVVNGSDPDRCGGLDPTCRCYFGAPLPISASGNPACVGLRIRNDYHGTMNLRTGEWHDSLNLAAVVYLGIGTTDPCPSCDGDPVPFDGIKGGTCSGGLGGGGACDVQGIHPTFGPVTHDCLPPAAANISGTGLLIDVNLTTGESILPATLPCETPEDQLCHCRTCTGNSLLACSDDAQCAAIGAGTCTAAGGAGVFKNQCENFQCSANMKCTTGPVDTFCDGATFPDGRGYIPCTTNSDCTNNTGNCTVFQLRGCMPDPLVNIGQPGITDPTSVSSFCVAPTSNPAINIGAGLPGPGSLLLTFRNEVRCKSDPDVPYEFPSGANCEEISTTTTTLLPLPGCEEAEAPLCGGVCPVGSACSDDGSGNCTCTGIPLPSCEEAAAPSCGGICGALGELCMDDGSGNCDCTVVTLPQCSGATAPLCGGLCPTGEICQSVGNDCECGAPGVPSCGSALAPTCAGLCDVGQACVTDGSACSCLQLPTPTCGEATSPLCLGTCAVGSLCQDVGGACQCVTLPIP